jgi:tRNA(fMet)-specific endonuclease VapC
MIVLDTQHVSQLQRLGDPAGIRLSENLSRFGDSEARIAIISPYEQFRCLVGRIHRADNPEQTWPLVLLERLLAFYGSWTGRILPFDEPSAVIFRGFAPKLVRGIGAMDARIAAIALANNAMLFSANLSDFRQVPGLLVEDWLRQ